MIKEIIVMIMMTGGGDKPVDASFIEVADMAACEERAARAIKVFPQAGLNYVGHNCAHSKIHFEDFLHNPEPTGPQYFFDLTFSDDGGKLISAKAYPSMQDCKADGADNCVLSYQDIVD